MSGFHRYRLCGDVDHVAVCGIITRHKVSAGIVGDHARGAEKDVDPATAKTIPQRLRGNVIEELRDLETRRFVDQMQDRFTVDIEDVGVDCTVEVDVFT